MIATYIPKNTDAALHIIILTKHAIIIRNHLTVINNEIYGEAPLLHEVERGRGVRVLAFLQCLQYIIQDIPGVFQPGRNAYKARRYIHGHSFFFC
jgi:hypothetical protein